MNLFQKYLLDEFVEDYEERRITRRQALKLIVPIVGSLVTANSILAACAPRPEETPTAGVSEPLPTPSPLPGATATPVQVFPTPSPSVSPPAEAEATGTPPPAETPGALPAAHGTVTADDPLVKAGPVEYPGLDAGLQGYLAQPAGGAPAPVILVCHENRGLTGHIQDVTRRLAKAGYVALAVDLLSRNGGTASLSSEAVPGVLSAIDPDTFVQDFRSGWLWLQGQDFALTERVGMMGFCFGGGVTWRVATQMAELNAAVPFYGPPPEVGDLSKIQAAVLAVYAERDTRITGSAASIEEAMKQNGKIYEKVIYPDSDHAFFNDTGTRYNPTAAQDAWARTLAWFQQYV
jgi:carboxymethylenebutenolidase